MISNGNSFGNGASLNVGGKTTERASGLLESLRRAVAR